MSFLDNTLSTLETITRHEAEINNLAGTYTRKAVAVAVITQLTASPDTITGIVAVKSDNSTITLVKGATSWALPIGTYVRFICTTEDDYFSLLEGTGSIVTSASGDYVLVFGTAPTWTNLTVRSDWQSKIDLAKQVIYDTLYSNLISRVGIDYIDTVLAAITNYSTLVLPCDYKAMELIYMDLMGKIGDAEIWETKADYFRGKYNEAFERAYRGLDFGNYGYLLIADQGRIVR